MCEEENSLGACLLVRNSFKLGFKISLFIVLNETILQLYKPLLEIMLAVGRIFSFTLKEPLNQLTFFQFKDFSMVIAH